MIPIALALVLAFPAAERVATPREFVVEALADALQLDPTVARDVRYLSPSPWWNELEAAVVDYAVNAAISTAGYIVPIERTAGGRLVRLDFARLVPELKARERVLAVFDSLAALDPYYHVPGVGAALLGPHLDQAAALKLLEVTGSSGGIYRADWFVVKALTTLDGGVYYALRGIARTPAGGASAQVAFFSQFGLDEQLAKRLDGDQRVAILLSGVTGKPRRVDRYQGLVGRHNTGAVWITRDIRDDDLDVDQHPFYNLLAFDDAAREVIAEMPNGLHAFALFDDRGALVDSVPDDVARDHRVPAPFSARLQPAIGCVRCHGPTGGLIDAPNDVKRLLAGRLNVIDDEGVKSLDRDQAVARLVGLYSGDFRRRLDLGRADYAEAVARCTGGLEVAELSAGVALFYGREFYQLVTPRQAAAECGHLVAEDDLPALFEPYKRAGPVDFTIGALMLGQPVRRLDYQRVFADLVLELTDKRP